MLAWAKGAFACKIKHDGTRVHKRLSGRQPRIVKHTQQILVMVGQQGKFIVIVKDAGPRGGTVIGQPKRLGQFFVDAGPVSYTHLTLPTTPYV